MTKLRLLFLWLGYQYVSYVFSGNDIFVVNGLRRSGNHAFINWFSNALLSKEVNFVKNGHLEVSEDGDVVLFNEVNWLGVFNFISLVRNSGSRIKNAKYVIISLEDYIPSKNDPYIPKTANKIAIKRSIFNVISSRLKRAMEQAKKGEDRGDMSIREEFIFHVKWLQNIPHDWDIWEYDLWLTSTEYKMNFLKTYSLSFDSSVKISSQGNGSSFSGQSVKPERDDLLNRWKMITIPKRVLGLLWENKNVLTEEEVSILTGLYNKQSSNT